MSRDVGRHAGRQAGRLRSGLCSDFFISMCPCIFVLCTAVNINVLLTVYKHIDGNILPSLMAQVTSNERVFQCISNFCHLSVATLTGKSCQVK